MASRTAPRTCPANPAAQLERPLPSQCGHAEIDLTDAAGFQKYADAQAQLIQKYGGRYIIRGGKVVTTLDGEPPKRFTIYVFDNKHALQAWRNDPAAKELFATRGQYGKFRSFAVEGLSATGK